MTYNVSLYHRTPTTRNVDAGYTTPLLLVENAPTQALQFLTDSEMLEEWEKDYENNITQQTIPNNKGNRAANTIDNGLFAATATIKGRFTTPDLDSEALKLEQFATMVQNDSYQQWGSFGLYSSLTPRFNLDPDNTRGFMIKSFSYKRVGQKPQTLEFTVVLVYGGTYVAT